MTRPFPDVAGVRHRFVEAGGLRVHLAEAGPDDGEPLVLLHGWPEHWFAWRRIIPAFAETRHVVCPDLRGHGWTDAPPGSYDKEQFATDLIAVLDALGLERVDLVAHDWGAFAGFLACLRAPDRFSRFVAMSMVHPWFRAPRNLDTLGRVGYQFLLATPVVGEQVLRHVPAFVRTVFRRGSATWVWSEEELDAFVAQFSEPERARATVSLYRTFQLKEAPAIARGRYSASRLTVPTLLLYGDKDPVLGERWMRGAGEHADDIRLQVVSGAGHFLPEEKPQEIAERVAAFVAEAR
jgi:pimeloyl-ACP methyl ester carboxylesterase